MSTVSAFIIDGVRYENKPWPDLRERVTLADLTTLNTDLRKAESLGISLPCGSVREVDVMAMGGGDADPWFLGMVAMWFALRAGGGRQTFLGLLTSGEEQELEFEYADEPKPEPGEGKGKAVPPQPSGSGRGSQRSSNSAGNGSKTSKRQSSPAKSV